MSFETISVRRRDMFCFLRIERQDAANAINTLLVEELTEALQRNEADTAVLVLEGLPEVFCTGADFAEVSEFADSGRDAEAQTTALYNLWYRLATGAFVSVAHVRGTASAGGVGFVAACDAVIADENAIFRLPEMLFGLLPACVLPFLQRRIGPGRAGYLGLTTAELTAKDAFRMGLVDVVGADSDDLLRRHLLKMRFVRKEAVARFKALHAKLDPVLANAQAPALAANFEMFARPDLLQGISHFRRTGQLVTNGD